MTQAILSKLLQPRELGETWFVKPIESEEEVTSLAQYLDRNISVMHILPSPI